MMTSVRVGAITLQKDGDDYRGGNMHVYRLRDGAGVGWMATHRRLSVAGYGETAQDAATQLAERLAKLHGEIGAVLGLSTERGHAEDCGCWACKR